VDNEALLQCDDDDDDDVIGRLATVVMYTVHYDHTLHCTTEMLQMHVHRYITTASQNCYWVSNDTFTK